MRVNPLLLWTLCFFAGPGLVAVIGAFAARLKRPACGRKKCSERA